MIFTDALPDATLPIYPGLLQQQLGMHWLLYPQLLKSQKKEKAHILQTSSCRGKLNTS